MTTPLQDLAEKVEAATFPGGAPDQETFELMGRLSDLQGWCVLMARKDSGGIPAGQLVQQVRAYIVERQYPRARAPHDNRIERP